MTVIGTEGAATDLEPGDAAALLDCQTRVLALVSAQTGVPDMLDIVTSTLEQLIPAAACSVLLLDGRGALAHGSAPSLPRSFLDAIDGLEPGPLVGACGAAASTGDVVVTVDIATDPKWQRFRSAADVAGLRACWSTPIENGAGFVVGTFAVYHRHVHEPSRRERLVVERLTHLVAVVLEHATVVGALVVSEERFRRAFDDSAVPMGLLDTDARFSKVNDAMRALQAHPVSRELTTLGDVVVDRDAVALRDMFDDVTREDVRQGRRQARTTGERTVEVSMSLVRGARGEPYQVSVTMLDVTEREEAQRERRARLEAEAAQLGAEDASRAKSSFLAAISHEMRTPLQAITGFAELLGTLDLDAERRAEALHHIAAGAGHLLELVDDTLDLSRIEAGALPLSITTLEVEPLLADVVDFLGPVAVRHGVVLTRGSCAALVRADGRRLRQVLINLVSNGIRYSGPDGEVRVDADTDGALTRITVSDNGPGIPPEVRARLFEPYAQASNGAGDEAGLGVGLGLMLAQGLTAAMSGRLVVHGAATASGTVAVVELLAG